MSAAKADQEAAAKRSAEEDDYKAKLAENRRLAREKAERESAEEQARAEERRFDVIAVYQLFCVTLLSEAVII